MKVRPSVKKMCDKCKVIKRKGVKYVHKNWRFKIIKN